MTSSGVDLWNTPERRALRDTAAEFTVREIVPHLATWEEAGELPRALHVRAAELSLLGLGFPQKAGGDGEFIDFAIVNEQILLSGGSTGVTSALFTHSIGVPHIAAAGDPWQLDQFVRPVLDGRKIAALGVTEPGTGSDVGAITTGAERNGEFYVVTGAKTYITSGNAGRLRHPGRAHRRSRPPRCVTPGDRIRTAAHGGAGDRHRGTQPRAGAAVGRRPVYVRHTARRPPG